MWPVWPLRTFHIRHHDIETRCKKPCWGVWKKLCRHVCHIEKSGYQIMDEVHIMRKITMLITTTLLRSYYLCIEKITYSLLCYSIWSRYLWHSRWPSGLKNYGWLWKCFQYFVRVGDFIISRLLCKLAGKLWRAFSLGSINRKHCELTLHNDCAWRHWVACRLFHFCQNHSLFSS